MERWHTIVNFTQCVSRSSIVVSAAIVLLIFCRKMLLTIMRYMPCVGCTLIIVRKGRSRVALMHRGVAADGTNIYKIKTAVVWWERKFDRGAKGKLASCPLIRWNRLLANLAIKWSSGTRIRELDRNHFFWSFGPNLSDGRARYPRRPTTLNLAIIAVRTIV